MTTFESGLLGQTVMDVPKNCITTSGSQSNMAMGNSWLNGYFKRKMMYNYLMGDFQLPYLITKGYNQSELLYILLRPCFAFSVPTDWKLECRRDFFWFFGLECRDHIPKFCLPVRTMLVNVETYVKNCVIKCWSNLPVKMLVTLDARLECILNNPS